MLCALGWHRWLYGIDMWNRKIYMVRYCPRCDKTEQVPSRMRDDRRQEVTIGEGHKLP